MALILDTELKTYEHNRDHLLGTAEGKFVLIHDSHVIGLFDSKLDAIALGYQQFGNVPFLVKHVLKVEPPHLFLSNRLGLVQNSWKYNIRLRYV